MTQEVVRHGGGQEVAAGKRRMGIAAAGRFSSGRGLARAAALAGGIGGREKVTAAGGGEAKGSGRGVGNRSEWWCGGEKAERQK